MTENPTLQDSQLPFSLRYPPSLSSEQRRGVYEGQVRAFLEASEIVEIDEEILDDILNGFGDFDHHGVSDDAASGQSFVPVRKLDQDAVGNIELHLPYGFYVYFGPQGTATPYIIGHEYTFMTLVSLNLPPFTREHDSSLDETTSEGDAGSSQTARKERFLQACATTLTMTVQQGYRHL